MSLSIAISILVCPNLVKQHLKYADDLLKYFVEQGSELYCHGFLVYNVHSMVHLATEAGEFGSLDNVSAFPFENYLQQVKGMVRSGNRPLVQIAKCLSEVENFRGTQTYRNFASKKPNNGFIMSDHSCCQVVETTNDTGEESNKIVLCRIYKEIEPLFCDPCDSRLIGAYRVTYQTSCMKLLSTCQLIKRAIIIEQNNDKAIFLAILHQF